MIRDLHDYFLHRDAMFLAKQSRVVQKPLSTNPRLNTNPGLNFVLQKNPYFNSVILCLQKSKSELRAKNPVEKWCNQ